MATTSETNVSAADLRSKSKSSASPVWQYFGFKADEDDKPNQRASFVLKRSLLLEETLQTFNGISLTIIRRRHKRLRNKSPNVDNQKLRKGSHQFPKHSPKCKDMNGEESNGRNSPTLLPTAWQRI